jgi:hypothetical protein
MDRYPRRTIMCPICCYNSGELLKEIRCGNFDQSILYSVARIYSCNYCGHIYNDITPKEKENLNKHYLEEYASCHNTIKKELTFGGDILCITQKELFKYLSVLTDFNKYENFSFASQTYKEIILDQFIEHIVNPKILFEKITEILDKNGILTISCPNSILYLGENVHFENYNFVIREHIQHFDNIHLIYLANCAGFELIDYKEDMLEILKGVFMPNIRASFRFTGKTSPLSINEKYFSLKKTINKPSNHNFEKYISDKKCYCYGIGREFLYLLENGHFNNINLCGLIDNTPDKKNYTIRGIKIKSDESIKELTKEDVIIITALAHKKVITNKLKNELFFTGSII